MKFLFIVILIVSMPLLFGGCAPARDTWNDVKHDVNRLYR